MSMKRSKSGPKLVANVLTVVTYNYITGILTFEAVTVMKHQEHIAIWLQTHDMAGFNVCIFAQIENGYQRFSRACAEAAAATNELLFSVLNGHYQI